MSSRIVSTENFWKWQKLSQMGSWENQSKLGLSQASHNGGLACIWRKTRLWEWNDFLSSTVGLMHPWDTQSKSPKQTVAWGNIQKIYAFPDHRSFHHAVSYV